MQPHNSTRQSVIYAAVGVALIVAVVVGVLVFRNQGERMAATAGDDGRRPAQSQRPDSTAISTGQGGPAPTGQGGNEDQEAERRAEAERQAQAQQQAEAERQAQTERDRAAEAERQRQAAAVPSTGPEHMPSTGPAEDLALGASVFTLSVFGVLRWHRSRTGLRHAMLR